MQLKDDPFLSLNFKRNCCKDISTVTWQNSIEKAISKLNDAQTHSIWEIRGSFLLLFRGEEIGK